VGCGWSVNLKLGLATNLINRGFVGKFSNELVSLNVDVLLARWCLGGLNIPGEEFLSSFGSLLLEALRVVLALVGLEKLIGVGSSRDYHSCIGASTEDTLVMHNILRKVFIPVCVSIRILILLFLCNYSRVRGEPLGAAPGGWLVHHF